MLDIHICVYALFESRFPSSARSESSNCATRHAVHSEAQIDPAFVRKWCANVPAAA